MTAYVQFVSNTNARVPNKIVKFVNKFFFFIYNGYFQELFQNCVIHNQKNIDFKPKSCHTDHVVYNLPKVSVEIYFVNPD